MRILTCAAALLLLVVSALPSKPRDPEPAPVRCGVASPKPLSGAVLRGLEWLVQHQHPGGGWGAGEVSSERIRSGEPGEVADVGDTCSAGLALLRGGSTPSSGPHGEALAQAVDFVCAHVERSDPRTLRITDVTGTRLQSKLGPYVDTFLASLFLAEVVAVMPEGDDRARVAAALARVVHKIETHQRGNGTWDDQGWAPVLSLSLANKGLARTRQAGFEVDGDVLERSEAYAREGSTGERLLVAGKGSAGVPLYSAGALVSTLQDRVNGEALREEELQELVAAAPDAEQRARFQSELDDIASVKRAAADARERMVAGLDDEGFLSGFGSNGGEEFLSYMNIGEALFVEGGEDWRRWDARMTANLENVQNPDGSWAGHHCITGRTFCTSSALLVLMTDRTPLPGTPVTGQPEEASGEDDDLLGAIDGAMERACGFLADRQDADGAWRSSRYGFLDDGVSLTPAIAKALSLGATGPRARVALERSLDFLDALDPAVAPGSMVYPAYGTALMAMLCARDPDPARRARTGDWVEALRGQLGSGPDDLSSALFALGALGVAGAEPRGAELRSGLAFVMSCQNLDPEGGVDVRSLDDGGFFASPTDPVRNKAGVAGTDAWGRTRFRSYGTTTADGLRALLRCGLPVSHPRVVAARGWLDDRLPAVLPPGRFPEVRAEEREAARFYFAWSLAHGARALSAADGSFDPRPWLEPLVRDLVARQAPDGGFRNTVGLLKEDDPLVATPLAMGALGMGRLLLTPSPTSRDSLAAAPGGHGVVARGSR